MLVTLWTYAVNTAFLSFTITILNIAAATKLCNVKTQGNWVIVQPLPFRRYTKYLQVVSQQSQSFSEGSEWPCVQLPEKVGASFDYSLALCF